jgi:sulfatase-like protein
MPMARRDALILARAALATAILSTTALLDFYASNMAELASPARVVHYALVTLGIVAICTVSLRLTWPRLPFWRVLLAMGVMAFVFFSYHELVVVLRASSVHFGAALPVAWAMLTITAGALAVIFLRRPGASSAVLALSLAFAAPSLLRIATAPASEQQARAVPREAVATVASNRISPDIYWIVLDGYPRQDVLREEFGFDNSDFVHLLTSLGFIVIDQSRSNFPATVNSISSTLNMDYTVRADNEGIEPFPIQDMYPIVRGQSRAVARLKSAGYHYVHFENGYDYLTECDAAEPRCVRGNLGLDELDTAILSNTPIIDLIVDWGKLKGRFYEAPFAWGGVADLTAKIDTIRKTPSPFFVYAHVLAPHPPIRFHADCSFRAADPDLQGWNASARPAFIEQLECVNTQAEALLRQIVRLDAGALIILQSDHGSAFRGQFEKQPSDWSEADLHERFGALNALRLPAPCRTLAVPDLTLVDTFPLVFSCLAGGDFKRQLPPRFFVTPYDDSQDVGHLVEYKADLFH